MSDTPTRVTRFGGGSTFYPFPHTQGLLRDNFGDLVTRVTRMPGVSGGYDVYGTGAAPGEVGNLRFDFTLVAASRGEMQAKRDAVNALKAWGVKRLYIQPGDQPERWVFARVNSLQMNKQLGAHSDLFQPVSIDFQVADPYWYELGTESWVWGDGTLWGSSPWGGVAATPLPGNSNNFTLTVGGNAVTYPRILVETGTGVSFTNLNLYRFNSSYTTTLDNVTYTAAVAQNSSLQINARALAVLHNGANAYGSSFIWMLPSWFRLEPGTNYLRVTLGGRVGTPTIKFQYYVRW